MKYEIGLPNSLTAKTGCTVATAENLIQCYEDEAKKILEVHGLPTTLEKLWTNREKYLPDIGNGKGTSPIYGAFWLIHALASVREYLKNNDAENLVVFMTLALHWASKLQIKPIEPFIDIGQNRSEAQKKNRGRRRIWKGLTKEAREQRNNAIIAHFLKAKAKNSKITTHGFAEKYAGKYGLGKTQFIKILKSPRKIKPHTSLNLVKC